MVGEDTHVTGGGGNVDLGTVIAKVGQYLGKERRRRGRRKSMDNIHASSLVDSLSSNNKISTCVWMG